MKTNYRAWDLNPKDFFELKTEAERLKFLLRFAVLAPSSHNSQPWAFKVEGHVILVYREPTRRLTVGDNNDRQLFLSLGCAIQNVIEAADYYGYQSIIDYSNQNEDLAATIRLDPGTSKSDPNHLASAILQRKTNRNPYKTEIIPPEYIKKIKLLEKDGLKVYFIDNKHQKDALAEIAIKASVASLDDSSFRSELSEHLKSNSTNSKIGMPGFTLGLPTLISYLLPTMMKKMNLERKAEKKNRKLFQEETPAIGVITTITDSRRDWLLAGQFYQKMALIGHQFGLSLAPWGAPVQIGNFYKDIQKVLATEDRPLMFFRLGYPIKETSFSPRLEVEDVLK